MAKGETLQLAALVRPEWILRLKREQLLSVLDSDASRHPEIENLQQIESLLQTLPAGFPDLSEWRK